MASLVIVVLMGFFVPALAGPGSSDRPPEVQANDITRDPAVLGSTESVLPFTGGQVMLFVLIGVGAIGAGTLVLRSARRASVDPA